MSSRFRLGSDFPSDLHRKLIIQVAKRKKIKSVYVGQFNRFGYSGASLLIIYFSDRPDGRPCLLKVTPYAKAQEEYAAIEKFRYTIPDADLEEWQLFRENDGSTDWGGLLYKHHGAYRHGELATNPKALRHLVFEPASSVDSVRASLQNIFEKLNTVHSKLVPCEVELRDAGGLGRYLRKDRSVARIRCVLGDEADTDNFTFQGAEIVNPLSFVKTFPRYGTLELAPIHGDLHPDNVILAPDGSPHLIDFAWARDSQDVLIDFVLLETSIRFNLFPKPINLEDHLFVDRALQIGNEFDPSARPFGCPDRKEAYHRLASAVQTVRGQARSLLGAAFSIERYLLTQFVVLYGLLAYEEYDAYASTRALGMIAKRLYDAGPLPFCRAN